MDPPASSARVYDTLLPSDVSSMIVAVNNDSEGSAAAAFEDVSLRRPVVDPTWQREDVDEVVIHAPISRWCCPCHACARACVASVRRNAFCWKGVFVAAIIVGSMVLAILAAAFRW